MNTIKMLNKAKLTIKNLNMSSNVQKSPKGDSIGHFLTAADEKIFEELEDDINSNEKPMKLTSGCRCKICLECKEPEKPEDDHFRSPPDAYKNMFMLLQQLTMLEPQIAPRVLGSIKTPTLFFRRERKLAGKSPYRSSSGTGKGRLSRNTSTNQNGNRLKPWSFLMFQSHQKTGHLEPPQVVVSMMRVLNLLKQKQQKIRKVKETQHQKQINDFNRNLQSQVIISDQNMNEEIPSFFLSSTMSASLRQNQSKPVSYIVHTNTVDKTQHVVEGQRIKQSEPFCLFRYLDEDGREETDKYQIFTLGKLQNFVRSIIQNFKEQKVFLNLPIKCIESYTRTKVNPVFHKNLVSGIFAMLNITPKSVAKSKKKLEKIPVVYYVDYFEDNKKNASCNIFRLAKLEVLLKTDQIGKVDPLYIDQFQLDFQLRELLGDDSPASQKQFRTLACYKSYKIVNVLRYVCNIAVMRLRLKWLLSESDGLVLIQCPQYQIDVARSMMQPKNRKPNNARIISNGLSMLEESYDPEDDRKETDGFAYLKQSLLELAMARRKEKTLKFKKEHVKNKKISEANNSTSPTDIQHRSGILAMSRSMEVKTEGTISAKINPPNNKHYNFSELKNLHTKKSFNFASTKNASSFLHQKQGSSQTLQNKFPILSANVLLSKNQNKNGRKMNKYRLRPFKTEESEAFKDFKANQMPEV